jgi:uncharacterized Zn ribbon protein
LCRLDQGFEVGRRVAGAQRRIEVQTHPLGGGDYEISCKLDGMAIGLKACFVKKA